MIVHEHTVISLLQGSFTSALQVESAVSCTAECPSSSSHVPVWLSRVVGEEFGIDGREPERHEFGKAQISESDCVLDADSGDGMFRHYGVNEWTYP